jgi:hypothetical protein
MQKPDTVVFASCIRLGLDRFQVPVAGLVEALGLQKIAQVAARISLLQLAQSRKQCIITSDT